MKKIFSSTYCALLILLIVSCKNFDDSTPPPVSPTETSTVWWTTWLIQPTCKAPCWQNITPGVTTKDEAVSILEKMPDSTITFNKENYGIDWDLGSKQTGGWLGVQDGVVTFVVLSSVYDNLTLATVVASYGYPEFIVPEDCRDGMCDTVLVYPDSGIWLHIFVENQGWNSDTIKIDVLPSTIVYRVHFTKTGIEYFQKNYLSSLEDNVPIMKWKEYGNYP